MNHGPLPRAHAHRLLLGLLTLVIFSSWAVSRIQSDWGAIQVQGFVLPTHNGQWLAGDLFRPRTATAENPAPPTGGEMVRFSPDRCRSARCR